MNSLDYLKTAFAKAADIAEFVQPTDTSLEHYVKFQQKIYDSNCILQSTTTVEQFEETLKNIGASFTENIEQINKESGNATNAKMKHLYMMSYLDDTTYWMDLNLQKFKQKTDAGFFQPVSKGNDFIGANKISPSYSQTDVANYATELLQKYNLSSLNLTNTPSARRYEKLQEIDQLFSEVSQKIGVTADAMGIKGTLSFVTSTTGEANFTVYINPTITMDDSLSTPSILLHEWIHAIDYHVGNNIVPGKFASEITESVPIMDTSDYEAFRAIKDLTQNIFSKDANVVEQIKINLFQKGTSNFFDTILGKELYLVSPEDKKQLESEHAIACVNNYLTNHDNIFAQENLTNLLKKTTLYSSTVEEKIRRPDVQNEMTPIKKYFDQVNENTIGKKSFYQLTANASRFGLRFHLFRQDVAQNGFFTNGATKNKRTDNLANEYYLSEPKEMVARYFQSQVFTESSLLESIDWAKKGVILHKLTKDHHFEASKTKILTRILGEDKITLRIESLRNDTYSKKKANTVTAIAVKDELEKQSSLSKIGEKIAKIRSDVETKMLDVNKKTSTYRKP